MGDPYLSSNESLILSTHDIRIDGVSLDLMLTSRRLILIDNSVTPFQLRTIPLETIITVVAGQDVKGDPIFTLSHMDPSGTGAPHPMDFIFTRKKGEQRVPECNEWAATLSNYADGARKGALSAGTLPYEPVKFIQPRMSATYRIETSRPRKPVTDEYPVMAEPVIPPVLPKLPVNDEIPAGTDESALPETVEMSEPFDSSGIPSYEPEETEVPDADLHDAGDALYSPEITEEIPAVPKEVPAISDELPALPDSPVPEYEHDDSMPLENVNSADLITTHPDSDDSIENTPEVEEPAPSQPATGTTPDENRAITDAERIWADAVSSAVSSSPIIPGVLVQEATPVETPLGSETTDEPGQIKILPEEPVAEIEEEPRAVDAIIPDTPDTPDQIGITPEEPVAEIEEEPRTVEAIIPGTPDEPGQIKIIPEEPVAEIKEEPHTVEAIVRDTPDEPEPLAQPLPKASPPPAPAPHKRSQPFFLIAAIVIVILLVTGGAIIGLFYLQDSRETPLPTVVVPAVTVQPIPTPLPTLVPADGVWVRIEYPGTFIGEVGNPELMHPVSGSGVQYYKILWSDRIVQASAQKQENSGDTLLIEVYNNGTLIKRSSTRIPMGGVSILIDPTTGQPPGIRPGDIP